MNDNEHFSQSRIQPKFENYNFMKSGKQIHVLNNNKNKWCVKESIQHDILIFWK
jgi:hypothetical protein